MKRSGFARKTYVTPPPPAPRQAVRRGVISRISTESPAVPKETRLISEAYRWLVRSLPCVRCGHPGPNQFCHADEGKGLAWKTDDRRGWSGCGPRDGYIGCHALVGTAGQFSRLEKRRLEAAYGARTRQQILEAGLWPKDLPKWDEA